MTSSSIHVATNDRIPFFFIILSIHTTFSISIYLLMDTGCKGIAGLYDNSMCSFLRNLHGVLHSGCTTVHSYQWWMSVPLSPHPHKHLLFFLFFQMNILTGVRYLNVVLVYISLIMVEHFFTYLMAIHMSSFEKCLYRSLALFLNFFFFELGSPSLEVIWASTSWAQVIIPPQDDPNS
uniref:cDNA FLJ30597 fis, clone BRAWH2009261, weakly similar to TLM PROTEIN n=1 Tax=Homo sapiens TaxID=9606 RepID=Q96NL9_HUMAN|nr:unnamed protein product [Homo sapiens]